MRRPFGKMLEKSTEISYIDLANILGGHIRCDLNTNK